MIHVTNGIEFERMPDGDVKIMVMPGGSFPSTMHSEKWIELVAAMSKSGHIEKDVMTSWARDLHFTDFDEFHSDA